MKEERDDLPNRAFSNETDFRQTWFALMPETKKPERAWRSLALTTIDSLRMRNMI